MAVKTLQGSEITGRSSDAGHSESFYDQALLAIAAQDFARALNLLDSVLALAPDHAEAYYKRGNVLKNMGRLQAAIASYDLAIAHQADYAYAYCNRGVVQQACGQSVEALASYDSAISYDPLDAMTHYNRGLLLQELSRWDEAIVSYEGATAIAPDYADAQYNLSLALLYCGHFEKGWQNYEWRWKNAARLGMGEIRNFLQPLWLGEQSLDGKRLLLHSEGGLGDTLQFCRYAALAAVRGAAVYLEVQEPLKELLSKLDGVSAVFVKGKPLPAFDYHCPMMSLPLAFRTTLDTVPLPAKPLYINRSGEVRLPPLRKNGAGPRIGLVWSGNPNNTHDHRRSVRLADWAALLPQGYQYFRLQKDLREEDGAALRSNPLINSLDEDLLGFASTAELCERMDLVISVDTSLAHLGGTLGMPTWVLLPFYPDWRWLREREDSPWYPTMRLFRQDSPGNWSGVFERVASALRREYPVD